MNEEKIQELLNSLFKLKHTIKTSDAYSFQSNVIHDDGKSSVESLIRSFLLDNRDNEIGILKAKVFMYEEIIQKSNFAPMVSTVISK